MVKNVSKRFLSLLLAAVMVLALVPVTMLTASAAETITGLSDAGIGTSYDGKDKDDNSPWALNGTGITGTVQSVTTGSGCNTSTTHYNSTLTITNNKGVEATLTFDYTVALSGGKIQVDGESVTAGGSFEKKLAAEESVKVYIGSNSTSAATKIEMTNVLLLADVTATATFKPAENGTYTVDGQAITEDYVNTQSSTKAYGLSAAPAAGYRFMGWYDVDTGVCLSTAQTASMNIQSDCTITARFADASLALFETGGQPFLDLNEANAYAVANGQSRIVLKEQGTLPAGNYTVNSGITLLIPYDDANTVHTGVSAVTATNTAFKLYRKLTMAPGAHINVLGSLNVGGRYYNATGSAAGRLTGGYGQIVMEADSSITVESGANLYAWGVISGQGSVLAESGANVYEFFQITDFRGGSATTSMKENVFPFSQYYVQNVEVPLTLEMGAKETAVTGLYMSSNCYTASVGFLGTGGMFEMTSGAITKDYDEATDRMILTVNGDVTLNPISMKVSYISINSQNYALPLNSNITISINSGTVTTNQDLNLLAGTEVTIAEGANLTVTAGKKIYAYSAAEWTQKNFVHQGDKFRAAVNVPGRKYKRTVTDLKDAAVDVNGVLDVAGAVYTTYHTDTDGNRITGAEIKSSQGTGVYNQTGTPGTETITHQNTQSGSTMTAVEIPITAARLLNADGTYTETNRAAAGEKYVYVDGKWTSTKEITLTVTLDANNGGTDEPKKMTTGWEGNVQLDGTEPIWEGHEFTNWNTEKDGTGTSYGKNDVIPAVTGDLTLYAQWKVNTYTVTWVADGKEIKTEDVQYGQSATAPEAPEKAADAQYTYTFDKWISDVEGVTPDSITADVIFTAQYTRTTRKYTITWLKDDGSVWATSDADYGAYPALPEEIPEKTSDAQYTYAFAGWTPEVVPVTGDATYTATYIGTVRQYTVTWRDETGAELATATVRYGDAVPAYTGEAPVKAETPRYTYAFSGWGAAAEETVKGDVTLTAQYEATGKNGVCHDTDGEIYYIENGENVDGYGLYKNADGTYYYFGADGRAVRGVDGDSANQANHFKVEKNNGLPLPGYQYPFGTDGLIVHDADTTKQGIRTADNGGEYWFVDGVKVGEGLVEVEGEYYYARTSNGEIVKDQARWIATDHTGTLESGMYWFGADGKLVRNGFVTDDNGATYYYRDTKQVKGFAQIEGEYYLFANSKDAAMQTGVQWLDDETGLDHGWYDFGADGKLVRTGFVTGGGLDDTSSYATNTYYYRDLVRAKGFTEIGGEHYMFNRGSGRMYRNIFLWVGPDNGVEAGLYHFGGDGTMEESAG